MKLSKKWAQWIACQGYFDSKGQLRLTYARLLSHGMINENPYPYVVGEFDIKNIIISFCPGTESLFPKKYVILPKKV